jgi:hypothetical protein
MAGWGDKGHDGIVVRHHVVFGYVQLEIEDI